MRGLDEEIPYRTGVTAMNPTPDRVMSKDEENYDTLRAVRDTIEDAIKLLYKDFNAFEVLKEDTTREAKDKLLRQIEANKIAYDILSPLLESIDNSIKGVDAKYKE